MTFGELRKAEWFKFDRNSVDVLIELRPQKLKSDLIDVLNTSDNDEEERKYVDKLLDTDDYTTIFDIYCLYCKKYHIYYEYEYFNGLNYINCTTSEGMDYNTGLYDHYELVELNVKSFKLPTIIIRED